MDHPPAPSFDPALLDMENMTADKWYALIYNRIVQQEDIFVGDIKKKVIEIINMCMNKPNSTLESVQQDITSTITQSQFEFEHQNFIDGIVGRTYEYLCQFIIKNSMENIKRTQSALNCFSLTNNLNYGAIKSCCNDNILLQGSSKLTQIQCLPGSNNNTTDSDKAIQSFLLSNNSENDSNSILMGERENIKNSTINKVETTSFLNYRSTLQIDNLSVGSANDIPLFNNMHTNGNVDSAHSSAMIEDDEKTTEAILSIASKIEQTNFNYDDDFEADDINVSNVCTTNEIQTAKCLVEQNGDQHTDPSKLEEEYKMNNCLKLLETLVNIEHNKLEIQKSITENEIQPNIETNEKIRFKSSKKTNIREKKNRKLQENIRKVVVKEEEEWLPSSSKQNRCSKNKNKTIKSKSHVDKAYKKNRKSEVQNTLTNLSTSNSSCSTEIQNDESISLALNGSLFSSYTKKPETIVSTVRNTKSLDTTSSAGTQLAYHNTKDCLPADPLKPFLDNIGSMPHDEKKNYLANAGNNSNALKTKTSHVASTSNYNEKDVGSIKNKSSGLLSSVMKASDYKKLYEKDRKSLFSPDVFITKNVSSKPSKESTNDPQVKKEHNLYQKKEDQGTKPKSKIQKEETNTKSSDKKRKLSQPQAKITNKSPKMAHESKSKTIKSYQRSSYVKRSNTKCKKLKVSMSDDEAVNHPQSNTSDINTSELQKLDRNNILENNVLGEGTSRQQFNTVNVLKGKKSSEDTLEDEAMPEWLRKKCEIYDIKPLYVVINRFDLH